jgi:hypothetical protein
MNADRTPYGLPSRDKCLLITSNIKVYALGNIYQMLCEIGIVYGIDLWRLDEIWKEIIKYAFDFIRN